MCVCKGNTVPFPFNFRAVAGAGSVDTSFESIVLLFRLLCFWAFLENFSYYAFERIEVCFLIYRICLIVLNFDIKYYL